MPKRHTIPEHLAGRPFLLTEASAAGVSRKVLDGARFRAPFRGVRVPMTFEDTLLVRCRAALLVLPDDAVLSHATAARLHGLPMPGDWRTEPVDVLSAVRGLRRRGVRVHESEEPRAFAETTTVGLETTSVPATLGHLATELDVDGLVVLGDSALRRGLATAAELGQHVAAMAGRRGVRRLSSALQLLEPATDSPMETRLRLLVVRGGLPRPEANRDVFVDGVWIARPDLSYPDLKIAIEYEGDHHRTDRQQWRRDKTRRRLLEDAGWLVIEVIADDIYRTPAATVARIRAAIASRCR